MMNPNLFIVKILLEVFLVFDYNYFGNQIISSARPFSADDIHDGVRDILSPFLPVLFLGSANTEANVNSPRILRRAYNDDSYLYRNNRRVKKKRKNFYQNSLLRNDEIENELSAQLPEMKDDFSNNILEEETTTTFDAFMNQEENDLATVPTLRKHRQPKKKKKIASKVGKKKKIKNKRRKTKNRKKFVKTILREEDNSSGISDLRKSNTVDTHKPFDVIVHIKV